MDKFKKFIKNGGWLLIAGGLVIIVVPLLATLPALNKLFDFSTSGQIGDTLGGTTAPFLNFIGAILVFYALMKQVEANDKIQRQIDSERDQKEIDKDTENLFQLYGYVDQNISRFSFRNLPEEGLLVTNELDILNKVEGGEAFFKLFTQLTSSYFGPTEILFTNQAVTELYSILTMMDILLEKLKTSKSGSKEIILNMTSHQFFYKICTGASDAEGNLQTDLIDKLPKDITALVLSLESKLKTK